ncbi:MAG: hypothetical protein IPO35_14655 [Uliginosibacterium sp.]|nr:hypothetical protein [Uliginosibacterium sp.]
MALFCTPVVEPVFQRRFDRIGVSPGLSEFHVVVDRQRPFGLRSVRYLGS